MSIQLSTFDKLQHDNVVFEKKNKELINEIALHIVSFPSLYNHKERPKTIKPRA